MYQQTEYIYINIYRIYIYHCKKGLLFSPASVVTTVAVKECVKCLVCNGVITACMPK